MTVPSSERLLVIKHGALGDFIQALGPMRAIRRHHPQAHMTLLTTAPYAALGRGCGLFDALWIDDKPGWLDWRGWWRLRQGLIAGGFRRVYDLQNSDRTDFYFRLFPRTHRPQWVGRARGASHRNADPARTESTAFVGHVQTLARADISDISIDNLDWLTGDTARFGVNVPYVLMVPGSSPQHPHKRWPASGYAALSHALARRGIQSVILGTAADAPAVQTVLDQGAPHRLDLCGQTDLAQIVSLARGACAAVGNDTGPMHLIAPTGCPSIVLFSGRSDAARHTPLGPTVYVLQEESLENLKVETVQQKLENLTKSALLQNA